MLAEEFQLGSLQSGMEKLNIEFKYHPENDQKCPESGELLLCPAVLGSAWRALSLGVSGLLPV
jgi:hypothetical protein